MTKKKGKFLDAEAWLGGPPKPGHPKWRDQRFARRMKAELQAQLDALADVGIGNLAKDDSDAVRWVVDEYQKSGNEKSVKALVREALAAGLASVTTDEQATVDRIRRKVRKRLRDTSPAQ